MIRKLRPLAAAAATALVLNAHAAVDMFLDIEGEIKGESQVAKHEGEIDVLAWSWGMSNSGSFHVGGGGGAGKANFANVSVTKWVDTSSPVLMTYTANGDHFEKATLTVRRAGETPFTSEELVMNKVLITSVSTGGSGGEDRLTENITLNFESLCLRYTEQKPDGSPGGKKEFCWNIAGNVACTASQIGSLFELPLAMSLPRELLLSGKLSCPETSPEDHKSS